MTPCLVISQGPEKGRTIPIETDEIVIGRDPAATVVLSDPQVSRRHLRVFRQDDLWHIEDLRSSNGTLLNGRQVRDEILRDGDIILMGETMMGFHLSVDAYEADDPSLETQTITLDEPGLLRDWADRGDPAMRQRAAHDLESLYRVGRGINGILKISQLAPALLDLVFQELANVQRASVYLCVDREPGFECEAAGERSGPRRSDDTIFSTSMAAQVLKQNAAVLTYDASTDARFSEEDSVMAQGIRSAICAPLQFNNRILGILYVDSARPQHRFTRDDLRLVAAIGLYAGAAMENAQLYERVAYDKAALHVANQQLKGARDQLVQTEKLAAVGRLASGIVHDMKNPMTVILGYTGMIRSRIRKQTPELMDTLGIDGLLQEIENGVEHVNGVISQLLSFAKPTVSKIESVSLETLVRDTVDFLKHETTHAGVHVTYRFPPDLSPVDADANQLKQVFINLVLNAVQAMDKPEKRLSIRAEPAWLKGERAVALNFADNGTGMSPAVARLVFEPFYTTKEHGDGLGGSGLGLSMSYAIIRSHRGRIDIDTRPGEGTTFRVVLPVRYVDTDDEPVSRAESETAAG